MWVRPALTGRRRAGGAHEHTTRSRDEAHGAHGRVPQRLPQWRAHVRDRSVDASDIEVSVGYDFSSFVRRTVEEVAAIALEAGPVCDGQRYRQTYKRGVPQATVRQVREAGVSIVWIEHIVHALLSVADRIVAINFGRKLIEGRPQAVLASPEVRDVYLGAEALP